MRNLLSTLLSRLDFVVLAYQGDRTFRRLNPSPGWFMALWPEQPADLLRPGDRFLFLDDFLDRAIRHWESATETPLDSGIWAEDGPGDRDLLLEASALCIAGSPMLLIRQPAEQDSVTIYQQAREQRLAYEHLLDEINKREILLHCIVHDLSNPLAGIRGGLTLLEQEALVSADGAELLRISLNQVEKMQRSIRGILQTFSAEAALLMPTLVGAAAAPDLAQCAHNVVASLSATSVLRGIHMEVVLEGTPGSVWRVAGDAERLERVFFNLVANALRYATEGETIHLRLRPADAYIEASVEDQGPGVPEDRVPTLFQRFSQGDDRPGQAGLGLHYCRITVEQWGGTIGYRPGPAGGACFWFRLPRPTGDAK